MKCYDSESLCDQDNKEDLIDTYLYLHLNTLTTLKKPKQDDCPEGVQKTDDCFKVLTTLTKLKQDDCPEGFSKHEYVMNKLCK